MNKEIVLKALFRLSKEDILDIEQIIKGYREKINKSKRDTILTKCLFANGYHSAGEFYNKIGITKDHSMAKALSENVMNVKTYLKLREILNIDNETFIKALDEIGGSNE